MPTYSHPKSCRRFAYPQRIACILLAFYLDLSYRDCEEWRLTSDAVRAVLELADVPDHSTLNRTFKRLTKARVRELLEQLLTQLKPQEQVLAADATGESPSHPSAYFQTRSGSTFRDWFKGVYAVGSDSQLILAVCDGHGGSLNDTRYLKPLRQLAPRYAVRNLALLPDCGFDGRTVSVRDIIPPRRKGHQLRSAARQARAELVSQARLDGLFGQRVKCETVHSVINQVWGYRPFAHLGSATAGALNESLDL